MQLVLGFGYRMRSGKDTAGKAAMDFLRYLGFPARHDFYAWSLKEGIGRQVFGLNDAQLYGDEKEEVDPFWKITPREILQRAGTEAMRRGFDEDVWCKVLERRAERDPDTSVIVTDLRYPNEVQTVQRLAGFAVRVDRDTGYESNGHTSEHALDSYTGWDYVIENDGSIGELTLKVQDVVSDALRKLGMMR